MTVITADDLGLCREIDDGICELHDRGVVGRASLLVNGQTFDAAVAAVKARPSLEVALHLNLTDGAPVLPPEQVPSLVGRDGRFRGGRHYGIVAALATGRMRTDEVYREWRAQAQRAMDAGVTIAELNAHGHLHLLPQVHDVVARLQRECGVPHVRLVRSREWPKGRALALCSTMLARRLASAGVDTSRPVRTLGLKHSGTVDPSIDLAALAAETTRATELIVHPARSANPYHDAWGYDGPAVFAWLLTAAGRFAA